MKKFTIGISIIILLLGLNGCVMSTKNVQINKDINQLKNKKLTYVKRQSNLNVITPLKAITSGFQKVGSAKKREIDSLYNDANGDFSIANYLSETLAQDMSKQYNLTLDNQNNENITAYDINEFVSQFIHSDYIIDNYVSDWRVMYYKFKFGKYYIALTTKMRLIDVKTKKIISEGFCQKETIYDENNPLTYDNLFTNNAKGLITESKKLSNQCLIQYKKLLNI